VSDSLWFINGSQNCSTCYSWISQSISCIAPAGEVDEAGQRTYLRPLLLKDRSFNVNVQFFIQKKAPTRQLYITALSSASLLHTISILHCNLATQSTTKTLLRLHSHIHLRPPHTQIQRPTSSHTSTQNQNALPPSSIHHHALKHLFRSRPQPFQTWSRHSNHPSPGR
jgi:hypothetical protein